jgi:hypothetical protein
LDSRQQTGVANSLQAKRQSRAPISHCKKSSSFEILNDCIYEKKDNEATPGSAALFLRFVVFL